MTTTQSGVEWVVATLAPWTISSHPNFREAPLNDAAALALVTERRDERERSAASDQRLANQADSWQSQLVAEASLSLAVETQAQSADNLRSLSLDLSLPMGARVAAAIFSSVALSDQDLYGDAVELLLLQKSQLANEAESASEMLAYCAILQQLVLRFYDMGDRIGAVEIAKVAQRMSPSLNDVSYEEFPVSPGISWSSKRVQRDVVQSLRTAAIAAEGTLEEFGGDRWVDVVRSRSGWVESRNSGIRLSRDAAVVRDEFDRHVSSLSNSVTFGRASAVEHAYAALLVSELRGNISNVKADREALGRSLMIANARIPHYASEAIRAFRRARSDKNLQSALSWIRNEGPSQVLIDEASHIAADSQTPVSVESLKVLEYAAEFLDTASLARGIEFALTGSWGGGSAFPSSWSEESAQWKTVSRLLPSSGADNLVARHIINRVVNQSDLASPTLDQLKEAGAALTWSKLDSEVIAGLMDWAEQHVENEQLRPMAQLILENDGRPVDKVLTPLESVISIINGDQENADESAIEPAARILLDHIAAERAQASNGVRSFGGPDTLEVAVAFALRYSSPAVWTAIAGAVVDPNLRSDQTAAAFDRMSQSPAKIPASVRSALETAWRSLLDRKESGFGFQPQTSINAALVRATTSLGLTHPTEALTVALELSSESDNGQIESTKLLALCRIEPDNAAVHTLLLQLSRAQNPQVRAEAGYGLTVTSTQASSISSLVRERIAELAESDGVRVPLRVMHGAQYLSQRDGKASDFLIGVATRAYKSGHARVVRGAALKVLEMAESATNM